MEKYLRNQEWYYRCSKCGTIIKIIKGWFGICPDCNNHSGNIELLPSEVKKLQEKENIKK